MLVLGWSLVALAALTFTASIIALSRANPHERLRYFGWGPENRPKSYFALYFAGFFCFMFGGHILVDRVSFWAWAAPAAVLVLVSTTVVMVLHNRRLAPPHPDSKAADGLPSERRPQ